MTDDSPPPDADEPVDPTAAAVAHLQAAGRELLGAARAFLDAAERAMDHPGPVDDWVRTIADAARSFTVPSTPPRGGSPSRVERIDLDADDETGSLPET